MIKKKLTIIQSLILVSIIFFAPIAINASSVNASTIAAYDVTTTFDVIPLDSNAPFDNKIDISLTYLVSITVKNNTDKTLYNVPVNELVAQSKIPGLSLVREGMPNEDDTGDLFKGTFSIGSIPAGDTRNINYFLDFDLNYDYDNYLTFEVWDTSRSGDTPGDHYSVDVQLYNSLDKEDEKNNSTDESNSDKNDSGRTEPNNDPKEVQENSDTSKNETNEEIVNEEIISEEYKSIQITT